MNWSSIEQYTVLCKSIGVLIGSSTNFGIDIYLIHIIESFQKYIVLDVPGITFKRKYFVQNGVIFLFLIYRYIYFCLTSVSV